MNITGQDLILACSAIGAGLAVIAGIEIWYWTGYRKEDMRRRPLVEIRVQKAILCQPCFLGQAVAETTGLYGLLIAMLLLFVKPLV